MTPSRVVVFIAAALVAAFGTAYYAGALDTYFAPAPDKVASLDGRQAAGSADESPDAGSGKSGSAVSGEGAEKPTSGRIDTASAGESASGAATKVEKTDSGADAEKAVSAQASPQSPRDASKSVEPSSKTQAAGEESPAGAAVAPESKSTQSRADGTSETDKAVAQGSKGAGGDTPASGGADKAETAVASLEGADAQKPQSATVPGASSDESDKNGAGDAAAPAQSPDLVVPTFDLVRVEPDGSMVVAGHAAPNSTVELVAGSKVLGSTRSGPQGDFAIVLDDPLAAGDYQIVLRSTTKDNVVATSRETAVVSVPDNADGQVLALVEEPGKPSRLITVPTGGSAASGVAKKTASAPVEPKREGNAGKPQAEPETAIDSGRVVQKPAPGKPDTKMASEQKTSPAIDQTEKGEAESGSVAQNDSQTEKAAVSKQDRTAKSGPGPKSPEPDVFIQAVEIDGGDVFVAGGAMPGARVRVYANDILLGEAVTSPAGRFLVQAKRDLPVGDYIVRADVLSADGAEVIARAAVPFEREPGEKLAAVAPKPAPAAPDKQASTPEGKSSQAPETAANAHDQTSGDHGASERTPVATKQAREAAQAPTNPQETATTDGSKVAKSTVLETEAKNAQTPEAEDKSDGRLARISKPTAAGETVNHAAARRAHQAADGTAKADSDETGRASDDRGSTAKTAGGVQTAEPAKPEVKDVASADAADRSAVSRADTPMADNAQIVNEPKLQTVEGAVIIRHGDTLWHISQRVYGHGTRYSTIYLANQKQIRDPDLIWPGQVFSVPQSTPKGETADMKAIGDQAVPADLAGTEPDWRQ